MKPIPVAILVRVSTNKQENQRQKHEHKAVAEAKGGEVVEVCGETVFGSADRDERPALLRVEELAQARAIKKALVHEISRIVRRPKEPQCWRPSLRRGARGGAAERTERNV
jgi:DNA invertase Pin-like site-specific DNA recombinase